MSIDIRAIDVGDETQLHQWWTTGRVAASDRAYDVYPAWEHSRIALPEESPERDLTLLGAYDVSLDGAMVGIALVELTLLDNTHAAWVEVGVPPEHRGSGIGAALLDRVEAMAREARRTHAIGAAFTPPGTSSAGSRFAAAHDYAVANIEGFKVLDLAESAPRWDALEAEVATRIGDYRVVEWGTHTPDEHIDDFARAVSTFVSMVPTGDLALEDGEWTPERVRGNERRGEVRNRRFCAAAIAPDGDLVGFTDLTVSRAKTTQGSVGITFVLPGHRGHSLGMAVKLANHRTLMAELPECEFVRTSNADTNEHMNAVNERMGYRHVEDIIEVQKVISS